MWLIKRYARKSIYHGCIVWIENSVTRDHCSASLVMPISDPRDRFFYPHHTPMKDTYNATCPVVGVSPVSLDGLRFVIVGLFWLSSHTCICFVNILPLFKI